MAKWANTPHGDDDVEARLAAALARAEAEVAALRAEVARLREALTWCSGSDDFSDGGKAREGWAKICAPLLLDAALEAKP